MDVDSSDCWKSETGEGAMGAFGGHGSVMSPVAAASLESNSQEAPGFGDTQIMHRHYGVNTVTPQSATTFAQAFMDGGSSGGVYQRPMDHFGWGGWGHPSQAAGGLQVKKRNAMDAELIEYAEVGCSQDDPEVGHNAPKIRTMDFDEAATMTKEGYIVDEAYEAYEKRKMEEWAPSVTNECVWDERQPMQEGNSLDAALKQRNARIKTAKRRSQKADLSEENWELEVEPRKSSGGLYFEAVL